MLAMKRKRLWPALRYASNAGLEGPMNAGVMQCSAVLEGVTNLGPFELTYGHRTLLRYLF